ncbi:MAG: efflux RND transporter periplasmic adaptor subunit [Caulobacter sp.]|nr:efflux RND transporter periplasmic adaptor subunit [Caulobacter sp.]
MSAFQGASRAQLAIAAAALVLIAGAGGFGLARLASPSPSPAPAAKIAESKILYWYDPMLPMERYPGPGKSSMNMDLIPKYADNSGQAGVKIDPASLQNLGSRVIEATRGTLPASLTVTGLVDFNQRDVAIIQARSGGFVQRVYDRAPDDLVRAGAPIADLLVPEWGGSQTEYLAVRQTGDAGLIRAARQRLVLIGMPDSLIAQVETSGRPRLVATVSTPRAGVIRSLNVRAGMTVPAGMTLAEINGLETVWINAAVPEALAGRVRTGSAASVSLTAFPGETFNGRVSAILPSTEGETRTLTARIELSNRGARLRPGMFATVRLGEATASALLVPSEAVIRTGERNLVMLALEGGRYQPAEVRTGREAAGKTEILAGLTEGEKVVASGQFLIDSEASLAGVAARPLEHGDMPMGRAQ